MIQTPMDILKEHPVRKGKKQKQAFRWDVMTYLTRFGYEAKEEKGSFGAVNMIIGDPEKAKYLVTAHYDTPARMLIPNLITPKNFILFVLYQLLVALYIILPPILISLLLTIAVAFIGAACFLAPENGAELGALMFLTSYFSFLILCFLNISLLYFGPANKNNANDNTSGVVTVLEIARTLPENLREKVCFVLFDLEEKGLIGSASYRRTHKKSSDRQLIINLDCVGDGDQILMFPTKKLKKDRKKLTSLYKGCGYFGKKSLLVHEKGFGYNPSDYKHFPYGVGIVALRKSKFGLYLGRIHTSRDTVLEETNVNILRAAVTTLISSDAAQ